jgi:hypothetical protein
MSHESPVTSHDRVNEANEVFDKGSLAQLLVNRARLASDRRLVTDAAVGLMAAAGITIFRPPLWVPLAALAASFGAFGLWGILDRELADSAARSRRAIGIARALVAAVGFLAAIVFGITLFFAALGRIIS